MGLIKESKATSIGDDARRARSEGHTVFAALLNTPRFNMGLSGPVPGWSEMVEAVEAEGWVLDQWTVGQGAQGRPQAYPIFRLRG